MEGQKREKEAIKEEEDVKKRMKRGSRGTPVQIVLKKETITRKRGNQGEDISMGEGEEKEVEKIRKAFSREKTYRLILLDIYSKREEEESHLVPGRTDKGANKGGGKKRNEAEKFIPLRDCYPYKVQQKRRSLG